MTPTQAQIDAAAKVICTDKVEPCKKCIRMATAALNAAAEVEGKPKSKQRMGFAGAVDDAIAREVAATIERCAQVAENYNGHPEDYQSVCYGIADAIRALATQK